MKRKLIYLLLFVYGLSGGVFFSLNRVRASSPINEISGGGPPGVIYDEHWRAISAIVTKNSGHGGTLSWSVFSDFNKATDNSTKPKMVVTKWQVHGHIHFP